MKYSIVAAALVFLSTGRAAADYLAIKVDLRNITLTPGNIQGGNQGNQGGAGDTGGPGPGANFNRGGGQPLGTNPDGTPIVEPVDRLWVTVYLELKGNSVPLGPVVEVNHKWGKKTYVPKLSADPMDPTNVPFLLAVQIRKPSLAKEYSNQLANVKKSRDKDAKPLVKLAFWSLAHGMMKEFHATMEEIKKLDPKHSVVANYLKVQAQLKAPLVNEDPASKDYLDELRGEGWRTIVSDKGHYALLCTLPPIKDNDDQVKRRLTRLEECLETFYYWFALQDNVQIPPMPRYRLLGQLISDPNDFQKRYKGFGSLPMVADGFTPRRDNIMVLSSKRLDEAYGLLDVNTHKWRQMIRASPDELLSGKIWDRKDALANPLPYAIVQTMVVIQKAMEEESERTSLSHEAMRQLLAASEVLPRNVIAPEWVHAGLASYFEIPLGSVYGSGGLPSWSNLVPFKFHAKTKGLGKGREVLSNVLSDHYFQVARNTTANMLEARETPEKVQEDWERARSTSWALVYYLIKEQKFPQLLRYTQELAQLPRDLDLDQRVMEGCFAKAFGIGEAKNALKLDGARLQAFADAWYASMESVDLELPELERFHMQMLRATTTPEGKKKAPSKGKAPLPPPPSP